jgi:hypothetical protein
LDDLIKEFEKLGWQTIDAEDALTDDIYKMIPNIIPAGESIIWGLAKETGKYEDILRYPAEDSQYEEDKINKLGL